MEENKMKMKIKEVKVGDIIAFDDGDIGVVSRKGETCLHSHPFIKVTYWSLYDDGSIGTDSDKFYGDADINGKKISKLKIPSNID